jgi:hypothetical protein
MSTARTSRLRLGAIAVALAAAVALGVPTTTTAAPTPATTTTTVDPEAEARDFPFAGPDTIRLPGTTRYVTYGATASFGGHRHRVPFTVHGNGTDASPSGTITGDAFTGLTSDTWDLQSKIWTPGAYYHPGRERYYLFFTAQLKRVDFDKQCIGVAWSTEPGSGYRIDERPLVCPSTRRWAIDADVTRKPDGAIWMTWRDGARAVSGESALSASVVAFPATGRPVELRGETRVLLRSDNLAWTKYDDGPGVTVIENPVAAYLRGNWYLFYSGNRHKLNYYATGVAFCGAVLNDNACRPMPRAAAAYFAYTGPRAALPDRMRVRGLPGNKRAPGSLDLFRATDGSLRAVWNYRTDADFSQRRSRTGAVHMDGRGADATFRITLR